jgi:predicted CoA-binding protein
MKKTLVIGASENLDRYSYKAILKLRQFGHEVVGVGLKKGQVADVPFGNEKQHFNNIDTVTLYVGPARQKDYYEYIIELKPLRVIFNPGTENEQFETLLKNNNIEPITACTLVMLATGQY